MNFRSAVWLLVTVLLACLCTVENLHAQAHQSSCIVRTTGDSRDALDVTFLLESSSLETTGALHFDVRSSLKPSTSDRELEIVFTMSSAPSGYQSDVQRTKIKLPEGATAVQGTLPIVFYQKADFRGQRLHFWNVRVLEDGRDIESARLLQANPGGSYTPVKLSPGERPSDMLVQRGAQNSSILHILNTGERYGGQIAQRGIYLNTTLSNQSVQADAPVFDLMRDAFRTTSLRHIESLPEFWQYYLQFSVVTIDAAALANLQATRPQAAEALKHFIAAGGVLLFMNAGSQGRDTIDKWLSGSENDQPNAYWESDLTADAKSKRVIDPTSEDGAVIEETVSAVDKPFDFKRWATRGYVRGRIVCFPGTQASFGQNIDQRFQAPIGTATSGNYDENWYLRNMIASVGKPPVWTFCGIILLFGLLLGPGLLVLTGWIGRRSLLILLVPLVSIGATFAIVAYQVLHEGFGTYNRITSILNIDERSGHGFVWSRQNYFSGWPPKDGMAIPNHVYCRPVNNISNQRGDMRGSNLQLFIEHTQDNAQWLSALPAREQRQFLIGHPAKLKMPIQIKRVDAKNATVRNLTDETLPFVVFRDGGTGYYLVENLKGQQETTLPRLAFGDIAGLMSRLRNLTPELPPELRSMGWARSPTGNGVEVIDQEWVSSLAEQSVLSTIEPYGFVTLITRCEEVFVPIPANKTESMHLMTGRAAW